MTRRLLTGLIDALWTSACPVCRRPLKTGETVCGTCAGSISPLSGVRCCRCTALLARTDGSIEYRGGTCPECTALPRGIAARIIAADYASVRGLVVAFKFERNRAVGHILANHLARTLRSHPLAREADVVVPVPLHSRQARDRGFNQSDMLARAAAEAIGVPCVLDALIRSRKTEQQAKLRLRSDRAANVAEAFAPHRADAFRGKRVLLVDDVITTGATVGACAQALHAGGAAEVYAAALAHPFLTAVGDQVDIEAFPA